MKLRSASARARVWRRPEFRRCQTLDFDDFFACRRRIFFEISSRSSIRKQCFQASEKTHLMFWLYIFLEPSARFPVSILTVIWWNHWCFLWNSFMQNCFAFRSGLAHRHAIVCQCYTKCPGCNQCKGWVLYNIYNSNAVVTVQLMQTNLLLCKRVENGEFIVESYL